MGQARQRSFRNRGAIDVALLRIALPVVGPVGCEQNGLAVAIEDDGALIIESAESDLAWSSSVGGDCKNMSVSWFQIALAVSAICQAINEFQRIRPFRAFRFLQRRCQ